jgi:hypothetical protein
MRPDYFVRIGRGFRLAALFCCFCLTGYSAFRASEGTGPLETAAVARESVATPDRVRSYASVTQLIPIEQLLVGQRVRSDNPAAGVDLQFGADIIPSEWRKLTLRAPKRDGTVADVVLLRPLTWVKEQEADAGGTVFISVPECGIDGNAQVLSIEPCPEILPGEGRVITGTFRHQVSASISLSIAGQAEPILCTGNHPFWSEDRQDFVRADSLQPNETLRTAAGTTTVTSFCHIPGSTAVYNLETHGTHVYHVGTSGVLVHNSGPCDDESLFNPLLRTIVTDAKSLPWGTVGARQAAIAIQNGAQSVTVKTRGEAVEIIWRLFQSRGYRDTTGLIPSHVKEIFGSKNMTIHWDEILDEAGRVTGHGSDNIHGMLPHVQIHDEFGNIIRIFFRQ